MTDAPKDTPTLETARAEVRLVNRNGLHARPAHLFVQVANRFASRVRVSREGGDSVDGKSIMGMMMLAAEHGAVLWIESHGQDAALQVQALCQLIEAGFDEE
ncbi:MAG: HPr family phosphocarrier protein [Planctomycetes bacterium]|nr:HPr family phosphocarrier protein [Planctomycetota bacterium]